MENTPLFVLLTALAAALVGWGLANYAMNVAHSRKRALRKRLSQSVRVESASGAQPLAIQRHLDEMPAFLGHSEASQRLATALTQAFPNLSIRRFLTIVALLAFGSFVIVGSMANPLAGAVAAAAAFMLPFLLVLSRRARRLRQLSNQLPEALDFLSRVLRAGHSLSTALQMGGKELLEPIASEFRRCYDDHSLGSPLDETLKDLAERIETPDFAFVVTAILIQRQTGGNLTEILDNVGSVVRSRIRLQQHIKAITAEGRFSGYILTAFPVVMLMLMYILNPAYVAVLFNTDAGRMLMMGALALQIMGLLAIRRIVSVKL